MAASIPAPRRIGSTLVMANPDARKGSDALRLQLGIPIEIVEPAFVQIVGRKQPAVAVQVMHRGLEWHLRWPHLGFAWRQAALAQIAGRAGGDHVVPGGMPAARARDQMVESEVVAVAAILAGEAVAQ